MPSRVSVMPFVASVPPPMEGRSPLDVTPRRSILVACVISVACVLVGGGVLLRARLDESGMPASARAQPEVAVPTTAATIAVVPAPSRGPVSMFPGVPTANVNDLPRAPPAALKRSPLSAAAAAGRAAARKAAATRPPASPDDDVPVAAAAASAASEATAEPEATAVPEATAAPEARAAPAEPAASVEKPADPSPDDVAPSSTAAPPPPDPLLLEMQKAVGGDRPKN
jgi:hypothetical protein